MTSPESGQGSPTGPVLHMVPALGSLSGLAQGCDVPSGYQSAWACCLAASWVPAQAVCFSSFP